MRAWGACVGFLLLAASAEAKPVVAVFEIQDSTKKLEEAEVRQLTDYLSVKIAEGDVYIVVPRDQITAVLKKQKKASYSECYDQSCQIEIGRELAAEKTLVTQIIQVGSSCAVTGTLYDLRKSATDKASSQKGGCETNDLVGSLEKMVIALIGPSKTTEVVKTPEAVTGKVVVVTDPAGARVLLDGEAKGKAPVTLSDLTPGQHLVRVELDGHYVFQKSLDVVAGRQAKIEAKLLMRAEYQEAVERAESSDTLALYLTLASVAMVGGGVATLVAAPGQKSIEENEFVALNSARTRFDLDIAQDNLDSAISSHNTLVAVGFSLLYTGIAVGFVSLVTWLWNPTPTIPDGTVIE